ncbi:OPT family small oligopeptide transporter [Exophiala mesophila]|uniref:OPT family small oligopeptide transporter n=2 Tax=Exophiala mesophila TaxID=212818 RepID=A0A0D1X2X2_EXOME|nr:OPT family small oligopeptide transporter [Exophiala mesophila]KIV96090.1 OPT family small oligopeptide transporter [Exophiala mesophila]
MPSIEALKKRFPFRRTNTSTDAIPVQDIPPEKSDETGSQPSEAVLQTGDGVTDPTRNLSEVEANRRLSTFRKQHHYDPNLPDSAFEAVDEATEARNHKGEAELVGDLVENSPYPEVRAVVRNYDEDVPTSTVRAWTIGLILTTVCSGVNALFLLRYPPISIGPYVVQLVAYPLGVGWAKVVPKKKFKIFGIIFDLNPGPFNVKEHVIIVAMSNAAFGGGAGYFIDTVVSLRKFYNFDSWGWGFNLLFAFSTQCLGFGLAGSVRRFLVEPAAMIWPAALVNVAFMYALHDQSPSDPAKTNGWSISRYRLFMIVCIAMFVYSWFPDFIFPALSYFAWITWIKPNNVVVNQLFGQVTGISLGFPFTGFTLDWAQINSFYGSPLIAPWHALANTLIGCIFFLWIVVPALHYTGTWYAEYVPILQNGILDNTGTTYNTSAILRPDHTVDPQQYEAYSPLFLSTSFALAYGLSFASITALFSHTWLFHGSEIWARLKASHGELDDIHMKIMRKYKTVPTWWYLSLLAIMVAFAFASACGYDTGMAWYSVLLSLVIAGFWTIPIGMVQAFTNIQLGLNVFTEFIIGYLQPGHPVAMMMFKTFGYIVMTQALYFCQDLKLGHYMHVPQRSLFFAQLVATLWSCLCQLATVEWALGAIDNICTPAASNFFTCAYIKTFYNASVIWGAVGPKHLFSSGAIYQDLQYFWLIGFFVPIIAYLIARAFPKSMARKFNSPLFFNALAYVPPYSAFNILAWCMVGYGFNKYIRDKFRGWWMQYNYVLSAALDVGLALCSLAIFFFVQLPGGNMSSWWGVSVIDSTLDAQQAAIRKTVADGEIFGPKEWKW